MAKTQSDQDILLAVGELKGQLSSLERRIGENNRAMLAMLGENKADTTGHIKHHDERLNAVERQQSWFKGGLAAMALTGGFLGWLASILYNSTPSN